MRWGFILVTLYMGPSAEDLGGLIKAFRDYEQKNKSAWRR